MFSRMPMALPTLANDYQGGRFTYTYDDKNQEATITNPQGKVTTMAYDALGGVTLTTYGNGVTTAKSYDAAGRLTGILNKDEMGFLISDLTYAYDKTGHRISQGEADSRVATWTHDPAYQLTREQRNACP